MKAFAYAALSPRAALVPYSFERRNPKSADVSLDVLFCGVCHSDIHQARDEWGGSKFPMVPGHEIIGRVTAVGSDVKKFRVGDTVGIGCMVDSCRSCQPCKSNFEQFCVKGPAFTYNSTEMDRRTPTLGGYSSQMVVDEAFILKIPSSLDPAAAAPLLCAGITTYSPLKHFLKNATLRVGVVGLGGLGHMAVKFGASMGAEVTVFSTSKSKEADAKRLGATGFELSDAGNLKRLKSQFDLLIDTVSADHDISSTLQLLRPYGTLALVGAPPRPMQVAAFALIEGNRQLAGSSIGGIAQTQEMLDFCAQKNVVSDIELISIQDINVAYERMLKGDVRYRFVVDGKSLRG